MVWGSFFQMIPCKCCCLKNLWMTWCLQRFFQVKVIFKVAKVLSPALLIRRFWGYIVSYLLCKNFSRQGSIRVGQVILQRAVISTSGSRPIFGRFHGLFHFGGETQMPVKSVRCLESHPKKKRLTLWSLYTGWNFLQLFWELCEFSSPKVADGASLRIPCPKLLKAFYFATKISLRRFATPFQLCPNLVWHTHVFILAASYH